MCSKKGNMGIGKYGNIEHRLTISDFRFSDTSIFNIQCSLFDIHFEKII